MIPQQWHAIRAKVDALSLRERALIFAAVAFLLITLVNALLLDPVLQQQKKVLDKIVQQNEKIKEVQAQIEGLNTARNANESSPLRAQIIRLKQELEEGQVFLKSNRDNLVPPERMADLLRQVLARNASLQLLSLQTLPAKPLLEKNEPVPDNPGAAQLVTEKQIYRHGVELSVRGSYLELMQYLTMLESMKTQMFWGKAKLEVVKYPNAELTLTLYTLSLDKTWLQL